MHQIYDYDAYIFDCDGVILDSNTLKIKAMEVALTAIIHDSLKVNLCVDYFRLNFGRSRFHHVDVFIEKYLLLNESEIDSTRKSILAAYSSQCKELYLTADITPGFIDFIKTLKGRKYIASGSEQEELRGVFSARGLDKYFNNIFGSPQLKSKLVENILQLEATNHLVMFGDAISDFEAAVENEIDFIGYLAYSNVRGAMIERCNNSNSRIVESWSEI
jgi:phosphoglycolate phosphatase-like HAD superfamily hydrolase